MRTVCDKDMCAGCMACVDACAHGAIVVRDGIESYNAVIDEGKCVKCGLCERVCQQLHPASMREPISWKQGWAADSKERASSSSGGAAAAISRAFVQHGGAVCSCTLGNGRFRFEIVETEGALDRFKGSKYVKSDPTGAYRDVLNLLQKGREVLFIGLPCQVSAMRNYCRDHERLYTVDLICHGTPSPQVLQRFLGEHGLDIIHIKNISFRRKTRFAVCVDGRFVDVPGVTDRYSIAFLNGLDYTENCYFCSYARKERVSDITIGDSWGSNLLIESAVGISLILCQTDKGRQLLCRADMELRPVNSEIACANNSQLVHPSEKPVKRNRFLSDLERGRRIDWSVLHAIPALCIKQNIKKILLHLGLWKSSRESTTLR